MVPNMDISDNRNFFRKADISDDPVEKIMDKYNNYPSLKEH